MPSKKKNNNSNNSLIKGNNNNNNAANNSNNTKKSNSSSSSQRKQQKEEIHTDPRYHSTESTPISTPSVRILLRHYHKHACRTKINQILDWKDRNTTKVRNILQGNLNPNNNNEESNKKKKRVSYFLLSEEYKRKISGGLEMELLEEEIVQ